MRARLPPLSRRQVRSGFVALLAVTAVLLAGMNAAVVTAGSDDPYADFERQADRAPAERTPVAPPREGVTVVTSHMKEAGDIVAVAPNGTVVYHDDARDAYWDVDPSPAGRDTVLYTATDEMRDPSRCKPVVEDGACGRQVIERANLSTGETEVLYSRVDGRFHNSEWHDVDRLNASHYVVADMYSDEVFVVNVTSGIVVWEWSVQGYLPVDTGGPFPRDWAHVNDVEDLEDGRIAVSLRNQDQVVFLDRETGVIEDWTLGSEDAHATLYEQHNADFIPPKNGGPALLVADSENDRVVEYQRTGGEWKRTWTWGDNRLQWPRDADRLPNGNTLVTDTHGGRIVEVNPAGEVVWTLEVPTAYEAERLGTGDESAGGPSAARAGLASQTPSVSGDTVDHSLLYAVGTFITRLFPSKVVNGLTYVLPFWVGVFDLLVFSVAAAALGAWLWLEVRWSPYRLRSPVGRRSDR